MSFVTRPATIQDADRLCELFFEIIKAQPSYISHGEIQMGVASAPGVIAPDGRSHWMDYILGKINGEQGPTYAGVNYPGGTVICLEDTDGSLAGFAVLEITDDGAYPFGMLCDIIVRAEIRGEGLGSQLLEASLGWFRSHGIESIYLESGIENHGAHSWFEHHGFRMVSHIFKLED